MWSGEEEFKPLLEKALLKPSKSSLAAVTNIAVRDEKWCYKSVCFDLVKAAKKMHKKQRLNVLYIISDICRKSKARLGSKDKYGPRFLNILPSVIQKLEAVPLHHVVQAEKVLRTWERETLFSPEMLKDFEGMLADAKVKAEAASRARLSLDKIAPKEKEHIEAPGGSPDTYDPFQAMDDMDLPGPPPQVAENTEVFETPVHEPPAKRQKVSPGAAAKEAAEQSGGVARAQAIADRLASMAGGAANGMPAKQPEQAASALSHIPANGLRAENTSTPVFTETAIPGVSAGLQSAGLQQSDDTRETPSDSSRRRRASRFDQPAAQTQQQALPPPPPLPSAGIQESAESMCKKALAVAAKLAASAGQGSWTGPATPPSSAASQPPEAKQPPAAGASAASEFEDDTDIFTGQPPLPTQPPPPASRPRVASLFSQSSQAHAASQAIPDSVLAQPADQPSLPRPPQPPQGPPPPVPPPRPPSGPRPPPGPPPAYPLPQHHAPYPHYPPHIHACPPPTHPAGMPMWHGHPAGHAPVHPPGMGHQAWGQGTNGWGAPPMHGALAVPQPPKQSGQAEDSAAPPPPPPLPSHTDARAVC